MSSDNGIYVLKTRTKEGHSHNFEYRVAHAQGIDNLYFDVATGQHSQDFIPEETYVYFKECQVFYDEGKALTYAHLLAAQHSILEYGVSILDHGEQVFREFTDEQLEAYDARIEELIRQHREDRER